MQQQFKHFEPKAIKWYIFEIYGLTINNVIKSFCRNSKYPSGVSMCSKPLSRNWKYRDLRQHFRFEQSSSFRIPRFWREFCNISAFINNIGRVVSGHRLLQRSCKHHNPSHFLIYKYNFKKLNQTILLFFFKFKHLLEVQI